MVQRLPVEPVPVPMPVPEPVLLPLPEPLPEPVPVPRPVPPVVPPPVPEPVPLAFELLPVLPVLPDLPWSDRLPVRFWCAVPGELLVVLEGVAPSLSLWPVPLPVPAVPEPPEVVLPLLPEPVAVLCAWAVMATTAVNSDARVSRRYEDVCMDAPVM
ncbi:MAG: hypothetical protein EOP36_04845 [Rubrivivax sp.]|nr:MAG: hypothetical protein EOP36_04845 [Rubrivivax sp.]